MTSSSLFVAEFINIKKIDSSQRTTVDTQVVHDDIYVNIPRIKRNTDCVRFNKCLQNSCHLGSIPRRNNRETKIGWSRTGTRHPAPQFQCCFLSPRLWSTRSTIKETWFRSHVDAKVADDRGANIEILEAGGWQGPLNLESHKFVFPIISPGYGPQVDGVLQTLVKTYAICVAFYAWNVHATVVMNNLRIHCGFCTEDLFLMFMNSATNEEDDAIAENIFC